MKRLLVLFIFNILLMGSAYAQAQADVQTLINTQVPITWQAGLSGKAMQNILTNLLGTAFTPNGTVTITPPPGSGDQGLVINQVGSQSNMLSGLMTYNSITITNEGGDAVNGPFDTVTGLYVFMQTGGPNSSGTQTAAFFQNNHTIASPNVANTGDHNGINVVSYANVSNGGTNTSSGSSGTAYGMAVGGVLDNGATNYFVVSGGEIDVEIRTGASSRFRWGLSLVGNGNLQAAGSDAALHIGATSGDPGFKTAIELGNQNSGAPLSTTGCVICTDGSSVTITTGIDLSSYTISGNFLKSPGFAVSGGGFVAANGGEFINFVFYDWGQITLVNGLNSDINIGVHTPVRVIGPSAPFSVGGFQLAFGGFSGQVLYLYNTTSQTMTIVHQDVSTPVGDRITTLSGSNVILRAASPSFASFIYDTSSTTWVLTSTN